jgi:hypothetical protein
MPIFESVDGQLTALRQVRPGADLYESEIEDLLWANLEAFNGTDLFPVARQPIIDTGGRPDVIALDESGRLVVFEVKRSIERTQLAQCLEYAGWARRTSLDTLCRLYHGGADRFFLDWQEFTGTGTPVTVEPSPVLVLVAQEFDDRTSDALGFLTDSGLPVYPVPVSAYEDGQRRRLYLIGSDYDDTGITEPVVPGARRTPTAYTYKGRRLVVADLIEAGFLQVGETIEYRRAREGRVFSDSSRQTAASSSKMAACSTRCPVRHASSPTSPPFPAGKCGPLRSAAESGCSTSVENSLRQLQERPPRGRLATRDRSPAPISLAAPASPSPPGLTDPPEAARSRTRNAAP